MVDRTENLSFAKAMEGQALLCVKLRKGAANLVWTRGESNPCLYNANVLYYHYTTSPP